MHDHPRARQKTGVLPGKVGGIDEVVLPDVAQTHHQYIGRVEQSLDVRPIRRFR
ncbi:MAG: hypothetical protein ACPGQM_13335 [Alphaproteobacteria bacterium]